MAVLWRQLFAIFPLVWQIGLVLATVSDPGSITYKSAVPTLRNVAVSSTCASVPDGATKKDVQALHDQNKIENDHHPQNLGEQRQLYDNETIKNAHDVAEDAAKHPSIPIFTPKDPYFFPKHTTQLSKTANEMLTKLFGKFRYKGVGIGFSKSLLTMKGGAVGIRVPISSHFPGYESLPHLPKVNGNIGIAFPGIFKIDIAANVPLPVIIYSLLVVLKSREFADIFKKHVKATDSVKRVGATLSFKFVKGKWSPSIAPQLWVVPPRHIFQACLPFFLAAPTLMLSLLGLFFAVASSLGLRSPSNTLRNQHAVPSPLHNPLDYIAYYYLVVKLWIGTFAAGMGTSFAQPYTKTGRGARSAVLQFNVDSLYPFQRLFSKWQKTE